MPFISIICLIAGVQGLFLTIHFINKKSGKTVLNRLVAVMLMVYSVNLINTYCYLEGFHVAHSILQPIGNYLGWWVGPSIYFYVMFSSVSSDWKRVIWIHYSPIILIALIGLIWEQSIHFLAVLYYLQFSTYLGVAVYKVFTGETDRKLLSWIEPLIYAMALIKAANITIMVLQYMGVWKASDTTRISFIILAAFPIFLIAYREMNATKTFMPKEDKYGDSGVSKSEMDNYVGHIKSLIETDKLYLNPELTLQDVAELSNIHKRKISQVINEAEGMNFSTFINEYRLKAVARKLKDPRNAHLSILGIARDCGFNSGGRFNTLFKKKYGLTPSQYRKE